MLIRIHTLILRYAKLRKKRKSIKNKEKKLSVFLAKEPQQCCYNAVVTLLPLRGNVVTAPR